MAELNIDKYIQEMSMKATETTEDFILDVIKPYCEEVTRMTVSKEYLKQVLTKSVPLSVIEDIKAEIDTYLIAEEFGSAYRNDIKGIIDKHISGAKMEGEE